MIVHCHNCRREYNDSNCWSVCPHDFRQVNYFELPKVHECTFTPLKITEVHKSLYVQSACECGKVKHRKVKDVK